VSEADDSQSEYSELEEVVDEEVDKGEEVDEEVGEVVNQESEVNETGAHEVPLAEKLTRLQRMVDNLLQAYRAIDVNQVAVFTAVADVLKLDGEIVADPFGASKMLQAGGCDGASAKQPQRVRGHARMREATLRDATLYVSIQLSTHARRMDEPDYQPEDEDGSFPYSQCLPDNIQTKLDPIVAIVVAKALAMAAEAIGEAVADQT
jgi:hypothetical protein